jgi:hypothetical protein
VEARLISDEEDEHSSSDKHSSSVASLSLAVEKPEVWQNYTHHAYVSS